ncbi:MAG: hypothetical protein OEU91_10145 [Gammaproteobacteria bacterium]|nr:hypothetical protein [Gammaproteobacteria bacterium]
MAQAAAGDAAWASFRTPLDKSSLLDFCRDIERLLRINPYLEFGKWESCGDNCYRFQGRNLSQAPPFDFDLKLQVESRPDGLQFRYDGGLKSSTTFSVKGIAGGSELTITEDYGALAEEERKTRLHEVDKSLVKWSEDLQAYLVLWNRWRWFPPWRFYMRRVWQPMKPVARRITYILLWISLVEVALIALGVAIYFVEYR